MDGGVETNAWITPTLEFPFDMFANADALTHTQSPNGTRTDVCAICRKWDAQAKDDEDTVDLDDDEFEEI